MGFCYQLVVLLFVTMFVVASSSASIIPAAKSRSNTNTAEGVDDASQDSTAQTDVNIKYFPHQLSLTSDDTSMMICSATLLSSKWAITAANCKIIDDEHLGLRAGSSRTDEQGHKEKVIRVVKHPKTGKPFHTDDFNFALLEVENHFKLSVNVTPATLPRLDEQPAGGVHAVAMGYGKNKRDDKNMLHTTELHIVNRRACLAKWEQESIFIITNRIICASKTFGGTSINQGDEGGALEVGGYVVGIAFKYYPNIIGTTLPDIFGNIASVRSWITAVTGV